MALAEVKPDKYSPADYAAQYNVKQLPLDYVLFTPAAEREDPCQSLARKFRKE